DERGQVGRLARPLFRGAPGAVLLLLLEPVDRARDRRLDRGLDLGGVELRGLLELDHRVGLDALLDHAAVLAVLRLRLILPARLDEEALRQAVLRGGRERAELDLADGDLEGAVDHVAPDLEDREGALDGGDLVVALLGDLRDVAAAGADGLDRAAGEGLEAAERIEGVVEVVRGMLPAQAGL